jgi:MtN3 and saliva related transmembrane protein
MEALAYIATAYGTFGALAGLLQARQMLRRRTSCDVSARFFAAYTGGYAIWLVYGLSVGSIPLIVVDVIGMLCGGLTLAIALSLRGSLVRPRTWSSCPVPTLGRAQFSDLRVIRVAFAGVS